MVEKGRLSDHEDLTDLAQLTDKAIQPIEIQEVYTANVIAVDVSAPQSTESLARNMNSETPLSKRDEVIPVAPLFPLHGPLDSDDTAEQQFSVPVAQIVDGEGPGTFVLYPYSSPADHDLGEALSLGNNDGIDKRPGQGLLSLDNESLNTSLLKLDGAGEDYDLVGRSSLDPANEIIDRPHPYDTFDGIAGYSQVPNRLSITGQKSYSPFLEHSDK